MKKSRVKQTHHLHVSRIVFIGLLLLALFLTKSVSAGIEQTRSSADVLAYATNVSISNLLSATNSYRAQNGLGPLNLQGQLNSSAQSKAQHMINNNYWSHVAPDGTQPWYFFTQAGYNYSSAGENLAYGFDSSQGVVDAWMNSPSHRANVLGSYADVGFGIANGESYQGNQNTVIVAHYGTRPAAPAPAPAPAPTPPPASTSSPTPPPSNPTPSAEPAAENTPAPTEANEQPKTESKEDTIVPVTKPEGAPDVAVAATKNITLLESLQQHQAPLIAIVGLGMTVAASAGFVATHRRLFKHALATGENFVIHHPIIDFAAVAIVTVIILSTTISKIG